MSYREPEGSGNPRLSALELQLVPLVRAESPGSAAVPLKNSQSSLETARMDFFFGGYCFAFFLQCASKFVEANS